jgi:hypothetical protein
VEGRIIGSRIPYLRDESHAHRPFRIEAYRKGQQRRCRDRRLPTQCLSRQQLWLAIPPILQKGGPRNDARMDTRGSLTDGIRNVAVTTPGRVIL